MPHHWQHHPFGMTSNMIIIVTFIYHFVQNESNGWFFLGFFKRRKNHKHQAHNRSRLTQTILTDSMNKKKLCFYWKISILWPHPLLFLLFKHILFCYENGDVIFTFCLLFFSRVSFTFSVCVCVLLSSFSKKKWKKKIMLYHAS